MGLRERIDELREWRDGARKTALERERKAGFAAGRGNGEAAEFYRRQAAYWWGFFHGAADCLDELARMRRRR